ncbi:MAG: response receiver sensor histidine kinase response regulator [Chthoniobacteraceae bacterium]|nr:response receiver sensor histidine kinase response regulator [Chthoniobacteraceae bacterium]
MMTPLNVLLVEDSPEDAELVILELRRGGFAPQWRRVETESEYLDALESVPQIILADFSMPEFSSMRALELLGERSAEIPFIIVSGTIGEENAVRAMTKGASDYVIKNRLGRLAPVVRRTLEEVQERIKHRAAEEQVRKLSRAVEQSPVSIVITDTAGIIEYVNPKFVEVTGYRAEEVNGRKASILKSGETPPEVYEGLWQVITNGGEWRGEFRNRKKNGELFWEFASISAIRDARGQITHFLAVKEDITEKKKLEAQIIQAQRVETIGTLAGGMAHDLNNILSPILMCTPMLRRPLAPERFETIVSTIEMSAERGAEIVRQVLTFSRGIQRERCPLSFGLLVTEMVRLARTTFPKSIRIEPVVPEALWNVNGDATQLHQVLLNLSVNARDAMPAGGTLSIAASNVALESSESVPGARPGEYVLLEVSDTGCGIPVETLDKIFDPLFSTKAVGKGTGLGLSTVTSIVKGHGGFITVKSQCGQGSTFRVFLPAIGKQEIEAAISAPIPAAPHGGDQLILVVDDEASIRTVVQAVLELHGYRTLLASDGSEGIAVFAAQPDAISLVITDIMMPFIDGLTLIRAVRRMRPELPIIVATGYAEKARLTDLGTLNIAALLNKPFTAEMLLEAITKALQVPV